MDKEILYRVLRLMCRVSLTSSQVLLLVAMDHPSLLVAIKLKCFPPLAIKMQHHRRRILSSSHFLLVHRPSFNHSTTEHLASFNFIVRIYVLLLLWPSTYPCRQPSSTREDSCLYLRARANRRSPKELLLAFPLAFTLDGDDKKGFSLCNSIKLMHSLRWFVGD